MVNGFVLRILKLATIFKQKKKKKKEKKKCEAIENRQKKNIE